jgi:hypothetical protein
MEKNSITFTYRYSPDYRPEIAMGIWGGINPKGLIEMNFYTEHQPLPETTTHKLEEGTLIGKPISRTPEKPQGLVRVIKQGILIDLATAKSIQSWLTEKIKTLEEMISSGKKLTEQ